MADTQNLDEVRRQIAHCEEDMKRAAERAREAVRNLHRATGIFGAPTQIDLSTADEALAEIREARLAYHAEASRREELQGLLTELEREESAGGGIASLPPPGADSAAALRSRRRAAPPPATQEQPQTLWRTMAIVALAAFSALLVAFALLVVLFLAVRRQQQLPVPPPVAVQTPAPPQAVKPPEAPKVPKAEQEFSEARSKVQALLSAGKPDDAVALLQELAARYASDPIAPRIRAEIAAALYAKGDGLVSGDRNAEALEVFRAIARDYPGTDAAEQAEKRLPNVLLAVAKAHEDRAELEQAVATLESLVKEYPDSQAAAGARQALPALRLRLAEAFLKLQPERAMALLRQLISSSAPEADAAKARKLLVGALLQDADERSRKQQFKEEAADLREARELDPSIKVSAGLKEAEALARAAIQAKDKQDVTEAIALWKELQQRYPQSRWLDEYGPQMQPLLDAVAARRTEPPSNDPAVLWTIAQNQLKANQFDAARPYLEKLLHVAPVTVEAANAAAALADHDYSIALAEVQAADLKDAQPLLEKVVADYSHAPAAAPAALELGRIKATPPEMVYVPAGEFILGLSKERVAELIKQFHLPAFMEDHWFGMQEPANRVPLKGYYIDEHPVTNEQYKAFVDATGREPPPGADWQGKEIKPGCRNKPVTDVDWDDACAYAKWAGKRLPTEAEWEKAARGTDGRLFPWGDQFDRSRFAPAISEEPRTLPVNLAPEGRSPYGASDMIGNVQEWTASALTPYPGADPTGLPFDENKRVVRGADAQTASLLPVLCLASTRVGRAPDARLPTLGFRCAKDAQ